MKKAAHRERPGVLAGLKLRYTAGSPVPLKTEDLHSQRQQAQAGFGAKLVAGA
jgi:hypothetical protein